jgi:uncharacterized membrane protein YgdD (TMEM256/DUF423 family)
MISGMEQQRFSFATLIALGFCGIIGAASVTLGALAAHALSGPAAHSAETASHYALFHAAALMATALAADRFGGIARKLMGAAQMLFAAGIVLFSGGLAAAAWGIPTGTAPWGGMALIAAWMMLALAALTAILSRRAP